MARCTLAVGIATALAGGAVADAGAATSSPAFGHDGRVTVAVPRSNLLAGNAVALPGGGLLIVSDAAGAARGIALTRLSAHGTPDGRFGTAGTRIVADPPYVYGIGDDAGLRTNAPRTVRLTNGRIVVPAMARSGPGPDTNEVRRSVLVAFTANGRLARGYGSRGVVRLDAALRRARLDGDAAIARALVPLPHGRLLLALRAGSRSALVRLTRGGRPDRTFGGGDGIAIQASPIDQIVSRAGGRILAIGISHGTVRITGYRANGRPDHRFGRHGAVRAKAFAGTVFVNRSGAFTVAGIIHPPTSTTLRFSVAHFKVNGARNKRFGSGTGTVTSTTTLPGLANIALAPGAGLIARQPDGSYIVTGTITPPFSPQAGYGDNPPTSVVLARYRPSGAIDPTFGTDGTMVLDPFTSAKTDHVTSLLTRGRTITVVGHAQTAPGEVALDSGGGKTVLFVGRYRTGL